LINKTGLITIGLDDRGSIRGKEWDSPLHHRIQTDSGAHPASYPMGTEGSFAGDKAAGVWSWSVTYI